LAVAKVGLVLESTLFVLYEYLLAKLWRAVALANLSYCKMWGLLALLMDCPPGVLTRLSLSTVYVSLIHCCFHALCWEAISSISS
jgi:hypothetical protein